MGIFPGFSCRSGRFMPFFAINITSGAVFRKNFRICKDPGAKRLRDLALFDSGRRENQRDLEQVAVYEKLQLSFLQFHEALGDV